MSHYDKIMEIFRSQGSLSSNDVTEILEKKHSIVKSQRAVQRHIRKLVEERMLMHDIPVKGRKQTYSLFNEDSVTSRKAGQKNSLLDKLLTFRRRVIEVAEPTLIVAFLLFILFALGPELFYGVSSINMTAVNVTGGEAIKIIFPFIPFVFVGFLIVTILFYGIEIVKRFKLGTQI